jgi:hypothetical protein
MNFCVSFSGVFGVIPVQAGMTLWPPHPAVPKAPPASPARGEAEILDSCLRRNDTVAHASGLADAQPAYPTREEAGGLYFPSPGGALGTAGLSRQGRGGDSGFLLAQE